MLTTFAAALAAATALAGAPTGGAPEPQPGGAEQLTIAVTGSGERGQARSHSLSCDPAGGDHPDPDAACRELADAAAEGDPFAPVPDDAICTMIDGGPATAEVTGTWRGERVEAEFSRQNGCEIARWDKLATVLSD
jgi:hypothetical protein